MKYKYICDVKALDLWKKAMKKNYRSIVGIVNIVFTVAMVLLTIRFYGSTNDLIRCFLILGCILFPVIQPLSIYGMSVKQLEDMPKDMELAFDDGGMHVSIGHKREDIRWKRLTNAIRLKDMIVIMSDDRHGYMLTNRVLGKEKDEFFSFLCEKINA